MPQNAKPLLWFASCVALIGSGVYGYTLGVLNTSLSTVCADLNIAVEGYGAAAVSSVLVRLPCSYLHDHSRCRCFRAAVAFGGWPRQQPDSACACNCVRGPIAQAGGVIGSLLAGLAADAVGPKTSLALNNLVFGLGALISALSPGGFVGLFAGAPLASQPHTLPGLKTLRDVCDHAYAITKYQFSCSCPCSTGMWSPAALLFPGSVKALGAQDASSLGLQQAQSPFSLLDI